MAMQYVTLSEAKREELITQAAAFLAVPRMGAWERVYYEAPFVIQMCLSNRIPFAEGEVIMSEAKKRIEQKKRG